MLLPGGTGRSAGRWAAFVLGGAPARAAACEEGRGGASGLQRAPARRPPARRGHVTPPGGAARLIHPRPGEWKSTSRARGAGARRGAEKYRQRSRGEQRWSRRGAAPAEARALQTPGPLSGGFEPGTLPVPPSPRAGVHGGPWRLSLQPRGSCTGVQRTLRTRAPAGELCVQPKRYSSSFLLQRATRVIRLFRARSPHMGK